MWQTSFCKHKQPFLRPKTAGQNGPSLSYEQIEGRESGFEFEKTRAVLSENFLTEGKNFCLLHFKGEVSLLEDVVWNAGT